MIIKHLTSFLYCFILSPLPLLMTTKLSCADNYHFYRSAFLSQEPRFEKPRLSSFDFVFTGGKAETSRNCHGDKVHLFDIYGPVDLNALTKGTGNDHLESMGIYFAPKPLLLQLGGNFATSECDFWWTQNIRNGFLLQLQLPVRTIKVSTLDSKVFDPHAPCTKNDCFSAAAAAEKKRQHMFLTAFQQELLNHYDLRLEPFCEKGVGDLTFFVGWTQNYQAHETLDYIDWTMKFGILAPTGKRGDTHYFLSIPLGYNGHWGIPCEVDVALGVFDWLTCGITLGALGFFEATEHLRMKTDKEQSGIFFLAQGDAIVKRGAIWHGDIYLKADHICRGSSFLIGYSFGQENKDYIIPCNTNLFNETIVNSDQRFQAWNMHVLHVMAEYDFNRPHSLAGVRMGFVYNVTVAGKRVFDTPMVGGSLGLDITWTY